MVFEIQSDTPAPSGGLLVDYIFTESGDIVGTISVPQDITIEASNSSIMLTGIEARDDSIINGERIFKIEIFISDLDQITYIANTTSDAHIASVTVTDNDPNISIAAATGKSTIDEGDMVELVVTSNVNAPSNLTIVVNLTDPSGFLASTEMLTQRVMISQGTRSKPLNLDTIDNPNTTSNGTITATLMVWN